MLNMHIKTAMRYQSTPIRMATIKTQKTTRVGKDVEKLEHLCTLGENVKQYSYYEKQNGGCLKN